MKAIMLADNTEGQIDLLLTDVMMPEMTGNDLYVKLSGNGKVSKVLYCSGYSDDILSKNSKLKSSFDFIQKPFTVDQLMKKVREVLDRE